MADALTPLINQLLDHLNDFSTYNPSSVEALDCKRLIAGSFDGLMSHLRKMMLGYENEEAHGLVKIIETVASTNAWYASGKTMMDMVLEIVEELCNIRYVSNVEREEIAVGFDDEVKTLRDQLTIKTSANQLQIISIMGAPGLGKTTLARYIYNDPFIKYTFHIRAWTCVSHVYLKRNLLVDILSSFSTVGTDEIYRLSDELLGEKLYRFLKDRPYLVVLDDIWDSKAWNELKIYFPDDNNGSRVIFTSRHKDVRKNVGGAKPAHVLRLRNEDESWEIFQKKVFRTGICLHRLEIIGREIANKCGGLPLAIVIISGLMKNKWVDTWWSQIAESQRSLMVRDPSQYMDSLALSYNLLPRELQHCFLFLGVFPEDYDIPVTKLIWLWVAQGLIHDTGSKSLEDVAEDFLMNLIQRSLYTYAPAPVPAAALPSHSGFCYPLELGKVLQEGGSMLSETYRTLRILDMESVPVSMFPSDVTDLVNLRYLAIQAHDGSPQPSISSLINLQTLIISSRNNILLPKTIWDMINLRHLYIKSGENLIDKPSSVQVKENDGCPSGLAILQTLTQVCLQSCENISSRIPNLKKLGFSGPLISTQGVIEFPNLQSLKHLQKLKLLNTVLYHELTRSCDCLVFPETLKKLTLSNTRLDWAQIWTFVGLPNLEVLRLKTHACSGEEWGASDDKTFERLKVLKSVKHRNACQAAVPVWKRRGNGNAPETFPIRLRRLVVRRCSKLNSIPSDLGKIWTLEVIEVSGCSSSARKSALEIQKEQQSLGNDFLKVYTDQ
uniref:Uncharacterized protein n=1 Tax=Tanacetum cinerariifolium TaxID=118510 RepID=A0A6L2NFD5_TANCI|nr:hypothetical protein [Tanacetum cinerariifolium]